MYSSSRLLFRAAAVNHRTASATIQHRPLPVRPGSIFNAHHMIKPAQANAVRWTTTHAVVPPPSDEPTKKPCCASKKTTNDHSSHQPASLNHKAKSSLPISSLQFWSDPSTWKVASTNTFRCLVGCTVGDMGMLFYLQSQHPEMSPGLAMAAAMTSGVLTSITLETVLLRFSRASAMTWQAAFKTATGMSLISMLTMEAVENAVDYHLMGWNNIDLYSPLFWQAIGWSALAGWSAPLPFNYWNLKRHGKSCH
ncbi:hypothetical protein BGZ82_001591 [Podila clonocystis]|nr:hypothetical protein BGZ82_001591 [Podila clonocystis]